MHDSLTPLGGMVPMINMLLGQVIVGGVGAGFYGIVLFIIIAIFVAGMMVGRTPEYLGKKFEAREVKMAMLAVLSMPVAMLDFAAFATLLPDAVASVSGEVPAPAVKLPVDLATGRLSFTFCP